MEHLTLRMNEGAYDELVHHPRALPERGDMQMATKGNATQDGNPAVVIAFTIRLPDGTDHIAQSVTTVRNFLAVADMMRAKYPELKA